MRNKLMLYLLLVGLIPTMVPGFFIYQASTDEMVAKERANPVESMAENLQNTVNQFTF